MKSLLLLAVVVIFPFYPNSLFAQSKCLGKATLGVQFNISGFANPTQVKALILGIINQEQMPAESPYCLISVDSSPRVIYIKGETIPDFRGYVSPLSLRIQQDGIKKTVRDVGIKEGVKYGSAWLISKLPKNVQKEVKKPVRDLIRSDEDMRASVQDFTVSISKLELKQDGELIWYCQPTTVTLSLLKKTYFGTYGSKTVEFLGDDNPLSKLRGYEGLDVPVLDMGSRGKEFVQLVALKKTLAEGLTLYKQPAQQEMR